VRTSLFLSSWVGWDGKARWFSWPNRPIRTGAILAINGNSQFLLRSALQVLLRVAASLSIDLELTAGSREIAAAAVADLHFRDLHQAR
jgi:hypothetical protein